MSSIDILIIALIIFFSVKGMINGLVLEAIGILGIILAFLFSYMAYSPINKIMLKIITSPEVASVMSYIVAFLVIYVIIVIIGFMVNKFIKLLNLGGLNRLLGLIFGGIKGAVIIAIVLWLVVYAVPKKSPIVNEIKSSALSESIMKVVPMGYDFIRSLSSFDRASPFKR